jgi:aconitate hydratase 2/2-methylisocitrate dehydratase
VLDTYRKHVEQRAVLGIPPLPLDAQQTADLIELFKNPPRGGEQFLLELITERVPPGVDQAAYVKAAFLAALAKGETRSPLLDRQRAVELLGTMLGGYNIQPLIAFLDDRQLAPIAARALSHTLLLFDAYHDVLAKAANNSFAKQVVDGWASAAWFTSRPKLAEKLTVTVFKVPGETNTDDLSPASEAWSRPDIPLHAKAMLSARLESALDTM